MNKRFMIGFRRVLVAAVLAPLAMLIALPVLLLGAPFWIVGGATLAVARLLRRFERRSVPWQELMRFEPVVGWQPRPHLDVVAQSDVTFHLTTDADGWRDRGTPLDEADVVVVGDSFAFGLGVDDRDFFGRQVSVPVKAVGAPAYSMVHGLLWIERLAERLRGKLVVWFVYYGNDPYENLRPNYGRYRMPFVRQRPTPDGTGEWELVTSHVRSDPWPVDATRQYLERLAELCTTGPLADRAFAASGYLIARAVEITHAAGSRLVVVGIPDPHQLTEAGARELERRLAARVPLDPAAPDLALAEICQDLDVPFVPLREHVTRAEYKARDCHWTPAGHARVARVLEELHRRHGSIERGAPGLVATTSEAATARAGRRA